MVVSSSMKKARSARWAAPLVLWPGGFRHRFLVKSMFCFAFWAEQISLRRKVMGIVLDDLSAGLVLAPEEEKRQKSCPTITRFVPHVYLAAEVIYRKFLPESQFSKRFIGVLISGIVHHVASPEDLSGSYSVSCRKSMRCGRMIWTRNIPA